MRFLCAMHRLKLAEKPEMAITCWQNGFDTGYLLFVQKKWKAALSHLGCAFETAEILLTTKALESKCACELFTSSALLLLDAFGKVGDEQRRQTIYCIAVKRLTCEMSCEPNEQASIGEHLERLYQYARSKDSAQHKSALDETCLHHYASTVLH